jgi:hypothetical protein
MDGTNIHWFMAKLDWMVSMVAATCAICGYGQSLDWATALPTTGTSEIRQLEVEQDGSFVIYAAFSGTVDMDPGTGYHPASWSSGDLGTGESYFVARYDANGAFIWGYGLPWTVSDIAVTSDGSVLLVGNFQSTIDVDPTSASHIISTEQPHTGLVVRVDEAGNFVGVNTFESCILYGVESAPNGNYYLSGSFTDTMDVDSGPLTHQLVSLGERDIMIARFNASDSLLWSGSFGGLDDAFFAEMHLDDQSLWVVFKASGQVDLDPGPEQHMVQELPYGGLYISRLDTLGSFISGQALGIDVYATSPKIRSTADGGFLLSASISGPCDLDPSSDPITVEPNAMDGLLVKYDASYSVEWYDLLTGEWSNGISDLECTPAGEAVVTGWFMVDTDLDPGSGADIYECNDFSAMYCAAYCGKTGDLEWSMVAQGTGEDKGSTVALTTDGRILLAGAGSAGMDLDPESPVNDPNFDVFRNAFIARYSDIPTAPCAIAIDQTTAIADVYSPKANALAVAPNPSNGPVTVECDFGKQGAWNYTLTNLAGETMRKGQAIGIKAEIDLSGIEAGTYIFSVSQDDQYISRRIMRLDP